MFPIDKVWLIFRGHLFDNVGVIGFVYFQQFSWAKIIGNVYNLFVCIFRRGSKHLFAIG